MWGTIVASGMSALAMAVAAYATYRGSTRAKTIDATAAPYAELSRELSEIRQWRKAMQAEYDRSARVVLILLDERPPHLVLRPEVVEWLRDHYPHRLIRSNYHPGSAGTPSSIIEPPYRPPVS